MVWASRIIKVNSEEEVLMKHLMSYNIFFYKTLATPCQQSKIHELFSSLKYLLFLIKKS